MLKSMVGIASEADTAEKLGRAVGANAGASERCSYSSNTEIFFRQCK
jgi:hypothetical protein